MRFRVLWHEFVISTPTSEVEEALAFLSQRATQRVEIRGRTAIDVKLRGEAYEVIVNGASIARDLDALGVLDATYQRVHDTAFDEAWRQGWIRVHAALVDVGGRRVLLAGDAGVGKTTLALRLLHDGASVHGDESVLLRDGEALAVPRPFHLKPNVEAHVPEVGPLLRSLPALTGDAPVWAFDPTRAGFDWVLTPGAVDAVVVLERASETALVPVEATAVMQEIVVQAFLRHESKGLVVREVAAVLRTARCYRLQLGDTTRASVLVRSLAG